MNYPPFPIPEGTVLIPDAELDLRSEDEIVVSLSTYSDPSRCEKNVWAYWHTGWAKMPSWTQRNVVNWVRRLGTGWTVRVLDSVPESPMNAKRYVGSQFLPDAFNSGKMTGKYVATHSADLIRLPLLFLYGGAWLDVGIILFRSLDDIWNKFEDPSSPYQFAAFIFECRPGDLSIINPWIMARKCCPIVKRWHETFLHIWGKSTECTGLSRHPLLAHLKPYRTYHRGNDGMNEDEIREEAAKIMDYGCQVLCLERLRDLVDSYDGWNGRFYFENNVFLLDAQKEMWLYQHRTAFSGDKQFKLLTTRYVAPEKDRLAAEDFVQEMLSKTFMMKFCHGPTDVMESSLADILDSAPDMDSVPGTFGEYLRWGSVHLRQNRALKTVQLTPPRGEPYHVGMLEPFKRDH